MWWWSFTQWVCKVPVRSTCSWLILCLKKLLQHCQAENESSWGLPCCSIDKPIRVAVTIKPRLPLFNFKQYYENLSSLCVCVDNFFITKPNHNPTSLSLTLVNCIICLKSAGLHEFLGWFYVTLFEGLPPLKTCLKFDGLSRRETIELHFIPHKLFQDCGH